MAKKKKGTTATIKVTGTDGKSPGPITVTIPDGGKLLTEVCDAQGVSLNKTNVYVNGAQVRVEDLGKTTVKPGTEVRVEQRASGS